MPRTVAPLEVTLHYAVRVPRTEYGRRGRLMVGSPIDASLSTVARADRPLISFAMGSPAPDAIPLEMLSTLAARLFDEPDPSRSFDYTPSEGDPRLRASLISRLRAQHAHIDADNLIITAGGMQGLDLVCKLFIEQGDLALVERPSYANGIATLLNHGAELVAADVDADGIRVEDAAALIAAKGRPPKVIYTIPTFQNPSGACTSLDRRQALLGLARDLGALVLEDDPYSELRYGTADIPSLLELDEGRGTVIQVRTFSKILTPGLRVGWIVAPSDTIERMVRAKQSMDTCANSLGQGLVRLMIDSGGLDDHVRRLRELYPVRRDLMLAALRAGIPRRIPVRWIEPQGGMFVWLELPDGMSGDALASAAADRGVLVVPGSAFTLRPGEPAVRLCFSAVREGDIAQGIGALADAIVAVDDADARRSVTAGVSAS